jgi:hypothetical protein
VTANGLGKRRIIRRGRCESYDAFGRHGSIPLTHIRGQGFNQVNYLRQIRGHHFPDLLQVHALIKVDELVAGSSDQFPGHFGMCRPELGR